MTVTEIIDEILPGEGESQDAAAPERMPFRVTDESSACWVLRRLAAIEAEAALVKAQAARRVEELTADRARLLGRFSSELEAWARQEAQRRRRGETVGGFGFLRQERAAPWRGPLRQAARLRAPGSVPGAIFVTEELCSCAGACGGREAISRQPMQIH